MRSTGAGYLCVWTLGEDKQETIADLEEVDKDDVDGEPCRVGRDGGGIETDDVHWAIVSVRVGQDRAHAPIDGLTMDEHTSTEAMLTESDKGVSTCSLRASACTAHTQKRRTGSERESLARRGWTCRREATPCWAEARKGR